MTTPTTPDEARRLADSLHQALLAVSHDWHPESPLTHIEKGLRSLADQVDAGARFKAFVHGRMDAMGIPTDPPGKHHDAGCRVGQRLECVEQKLAAAERDRDEWKLARNEQALADMAIIKDIRLHATRMELERDSCVQQIKDYVRRAEDDLGVVKQERDALRATLDKVESAQSMLSVYMPTHEMLRRVSPFLTAVDSEDHPLARVSMLVTVLHGILKPDAGEVALERGQTRAELIKDGFQPGTEAELREAIDGMDAGGKAETP